MLTQCVGMLLDGEVGGVSDVEIVLFGEAYEGVFVPEEVSRTVSVRVGAIERNDPCVCGSASKFKDCCAVRGTLEHFLPVNAR